MAQQFHHCTRLRVRYADTDAMGVVYYANYLAYFEVGRVELLRAAGADNRAIEEAGAVAAVTRADCRYLAPARFDDLLAIHTSLAELGRASLRFEYEVRREADGALLAEGFTEHVCLDRQTCVRHACQPASALRWRKQCRPEHSLVILRGAKDRVPGRPTPLFSRQRRMTESGLSRHPSLSLRA